MSGHSQVTFNLPAVEGRSRAETHAYAELLYHSAANELHATARLADGMLAAERAAAAGLVRALGEERAQELRNGGHRDASATEQALAAAKAATRASMLERLAGALELPPAGETQSLMGEATGRARELVEVEAALRASRRATRRRFGPHPRTGGKGGGGTGGTGPWIFTPPYDATWSVTSASANGFGVDARRMPPLTPGNPTNVQDAATGLVGQNYAMDNPSDSVLGRAHNGSTSVTFVARDLVGVWFEVPEQGRIQADITASCVQGLIQIAASSSWLGGSGSIRVTNELVLEIVHNASVSVDGQVVVVGEADTDFTFDTAFPNPGDLAEVQLTSSSAWNPGDGIFVFAGSRTSVLGSGDDDLLSAFGDFQWTIESIELSVA